MQLHASEQMSIAHDSASKCYIKCDSCATKQSFSSNTWLSVGDKVEMATLLAKNKIRNCCVAAEFISLIGKYVTKMSDILSANGPICSLSRRS